MKPLDQKDLKEPTTAYLFTSCAFVLVGLYAAYAAIFSIDGEYLDGFTANLIILVCILSSGFMFGLYKEGVQERAYRAAEVQHAHLKTR